MTDNKPNAEAKEKLETPSPIVIDIIEQAIKEIEKGDFQLGIEKIEYHFKKCNDADSRFILNAELIIAYIKASKFSQAEKSLQTMSSEFRNSINKPLHENCCRRIFNACTDLLDKTEDEKDKGNISLLQKNLIERLNKNYPEIKLTIPENTLHLDPTKSEKQQIIDYIIKEFIKKARFKSSKILKKRKIKILNTSQIKKFIPSASNYLNQKITNKDIENIKEIEIKNLLTDSNNLFKPRDHVFDQYHVKEILNKGKEGEIFLLRKKNYIDKIIKTYYLSKYQTHDWGDLNGIQQKNLLLNYKEIKNKIEHDLENEKQIIQQCFDKNKLYFNPIEKVLNLRSTIYVKTFQAIQLDLPTIVMGYIETFKLEDIFRLDFYSKLSIFKKIVEGVQIIHSLDVVHLDLDLGKNIVFEKNNHEINPKIIDFGCAKKIGEELQLLTGKEFYFPPEYEECIRKKIKLKSEKSIDLWSVGIIGGEIFFGKKNYFYKKNQTELLNDEKIIFELLSNICKENPQERLPTELILKYIDENFYDKLKDKKEPLSNTLRITYKDVKTTEEKDVKTTEEKDVKTTEEKDVKTTEEKDVKTIEGKNKLLINENKLNLLWISIILLSLAIGLILGVLL